MSADGAPDDCGNRNFVLGRQLLQLDGELIVDADMDVLHKLSTGTPVSGDIG